MTGMQRAGAARSKAAAMNGSMKLKTFIPVRFVRHKVSKVVVAPPSPGRMASPLNPGQPRAVDENLMSALAKAFFWQEVLDSGRVDHINALATLEGSERIRVNKFLKLARLAPDIVADIASGRQPVGLSLEFFMRNPLPADWDVQRRLVAGMTRNRQLTGFSKAI